MKVNFYKTPSGNSVLKKYIDDLSLKEMAIILECIDYIKRDDFDYKKADFIKHIKGKINEIKIVSSGYSFRIFYSIVDSEMYLLTIFKKTTQKAPKREIQIAEKRLTEIINEKNKQKNK